MPIRCFSLLSPTLLLPLSSPTPFFAVAFPTYSPRTYIDPVIFKETRSGYSMMMDAMVLSHRSYEGEKYAYVIVDVGPCGVDGVLELIVEGAGQ